LNEDNLQINFDEACIKSFADQTSQAVYNTSSGGGAMIVDKYQPQERFLVAICSSGAQ